MRKLKLGAAVGLLLVMIPGPAAAEPGPPKYESSSPEKGAEEHDVDEVSVRFNEPLDLNSSELSVSACDKDVTAGPPEVVGDTISVELDKNPPGTYTVAYSVSGLDDTPEERAEPTEGTFRFSIHYPECDDHDDDHDGKHGNGKNGDENDHDGKHGDHRNNDHDGDHRGGDSGHMGHPGGDGGTTHTDHTSSSDHTTHSSGDHKSTDGHAGSGDHEGKKDHRGEHGKRHGEKGDGKHEGHRESGNNGGKDPSSAAPRRAERPNPVLNLALVLLIPALVGLIGGRALRARAVPTAS